MPEQTELGRDLIERLTLVVDFSFARQVLLRIRMHPAQITSFAPGSRPTLARLADAHLRDAVPVSQPVYDEIRAELVEAGYEHAFHTMPGEREVIDLHGLALVVEEPATSKPANG